MPRFRASERLDCSKAKLRHHRIENEMIAWDFIQMRVNGTQASYGTVQGI